MGWRCERELSFLLKYAPSVWQGCIAIRAHVEVNPSFRHIKVGVWAVFFETGFHQLKLTVIVCPVPGATTMPNSVGILTT